MLHFISLFFFFLSTTWASLTPPEFYMNEWVIKTNGGPEEAELIALQHGFTFQKKLMGFNNTYQFIRNNHPTRSKRDAQLITNTLIKDDRIIWAEQQSAKKRTKRDNQLISQEVEGVFNRIDDLVQAIWDAIGIKPIPKKSERFNDKYWSNEWYLTDSYRTLNVLPVWDQGITGKGVRVSILDDGIDGFHIDLFENYDPDISYDVNGDKFDPTPRYDVFETNSHGTKCAGEVAMMANNRICGVGIAYEAKIGGVRMLDGTVNDMVEGKALTYANDKVDIYSSSWGPNDDGKTVDGPRRLAREAFEIGATKGRGGKGAIFVWASGNGGQLGDSCSCDGYVNSIYTLAVSSATQSGVFPWYGEKCAGVLTSTYSSGGLMDNMVVATNLNNTCTTRHSGTSASAPMAAAIIALALQANPMLTWRDVQHLVVVSANPKPVLNNRGWVTNGANRLVSPKFGYGLMDAGKMIQHAQGWTLTLYRSFQYNLIVNCPEVRYLEHVLLTVNIHSDVRGEIEIFLTSPLNTRSQLMFRRGLDRSEDGFQNWAILSVQNWNEDPDGIWQLEFRDYCGIMCSKGSSGNITLTVFGTKEPPHYLLSGPEVNTLTATA